jgi:hypothetical protein
MDTGLHTDSQNRIQLVLSSSEEIKKHTLEALRQFTLAGYCVAVISITLPYIVIRRIYEKEGIDLSRVYIIDAVTRYSGGQATNTTEHCVFISNPGNLTDIGIAMGEMLGAMPDGKKCLMVDDISTFLLYSPSGTTMKFVHFVTNKLRILDVNGILFAVEKGLSPAIIAQLTTFSDTVVTAGAPGPV